jgi:hypothetical protein
MHGRHTRKVGDVGAVELLQARKKIRELPMETKQRDARRVTVGVINASAERSPNGKNLAQRLMRTT